MMKLAAQLYTLRDYCRNQEELFDTLTQIGSMGYDGVELESSLIKGADREALKELLEKLGLKVCSIRSSFGRMGFDKAGMIEEAKVLSSAYTGIGTITSGYCFNNVGPAGFCRFTKEALEKGQVLKAEGLTGLYSLRSHEFVREADKKWCFDYLEEAFRDGTVVFEADVFHLIKAGLDPKEIFTRLSGRLPVVRFRDQRVAVGEVSFFYPVRENCPVGDGLFDFEDYLPVLKEAGTEWITLGQEYCTRDPFECMKRSLEFGRKIL